MILLTGSTGFIGKHYKETYPDGLLCPTHKELDLTDWDKVKNYLHENKPEKIIHCASNDRDVCLYDNLRMFHNLAESGIPMITFCTGREVEDRSYKNGEYVLSKKIAKDLALSVYKHITVIQIWGCFGAHEKDIRFFKSSINRINQGLPILINEDRMFSYVYVKDLVNIMRNITPGVEPRLVRPVAYTQFLSDYALWLREKCVIEKEVFCHSYVGQDNVPYPYMPLDLAIEDMRRDIANAK